jgi:hypothetical protein
MTVSPNPPRLYFLWDYDLTEEQVRALLRNGSPVEQAWLIGRILEHCRWNDIWRYLTVKQIQEHLGQVHFRRPADRELWTYALARWTSHE